jgi:mannose-6-phosphate isomerase-like protein (cupin superfamily)
VPEQPAYNMNMNVKFGALEAVDVGRIQSECSETWFNQTLCRVNDCVVRLGIVKGEFHWHRHDNEDEFFYVVDGKLFVDIEGRTFELAPKQGVTVPKGVLHRTRAPERTTMLMIEGAAVKPTGD